MFGDAFRPHVADPTPIPPTAHVDTSELLAMLAAIHDAIARMDVRPLVEIPPLDLSALTEILAGKFGFNAQELAEAVAAALPPPVAPPDSVTGMAEILEALRLLDFRLKGMGPGGGGGPGNDGIHSRLDTLIANQAASPETGLAKDATLTARLPDLVGAWDYDAGVAGTLNVAASRRVVGIAASATTIAGSFTINGGATITVPANQSIAIAPLANLVAPVLVFTNTASYFVEHIA